MQRILLLSLILFAFALSGCGSFQTVKDSWKYTKKQYRTYLNTPAELDLDDTGSCELYELALSEAVIDVDEELQKLIRAMENSDHNPDQVWVMNIMTRIPWLSGVALIDNSGTVEAQYPEYFAKPFDASPLVEPDPKQRLGALRAYVQMTDQGPEVYVGNPVYSGQEMRGIIVAYFDPRVLVTVSSAPGSFMIASPAGVLWPGRFGSGNVVGSTDWERLLAHTSCGTIGSKENEFFWTTRYVGNLPLVYALPTNAGRENLLPGDAPAASSQPSPASASPVPQPPVADAPPQAEAPAPIGGQTPDQNEPQIAWPERGPDFVAPIEAPKTENSSPGAMVPSEQKEGTARDSEPQTPAESPAPAQG